MESNNTRVFIAETVGTAILVLGGCGTAVFAADVVGVLGVATAFGLSLLVLAYAIGGISGCHVNPAVTLGMWIGGKIESGMLLVYWAAQILGGLVGGLILWATFTLSDKDLPAGFASNGFGDHSPSLFNLGSVALIEIVMTALLIMVVLSTTHLELPDRVRRHRGGHVAVVDPPHLDPDLEHLGQPRPQHGRGALRQRGLAQDAALGLLRVPPHRWRRGRLPVEGRRRRRAPRRHHHTLTHRRR